MDGMRLRLGRPLLAGSASQRAGGLLFYCAVLIAVLGIVFAHQAKADRLDHAVDSPIITWLGSHQGLALWLAAPGSYLPAAALSAAIVIACLVAGRLGGAVLAMAAVPSAVGLNDGLLKHLVHRTELGVLSYPSGHTAAVTAVVATVTVLLVVPPQRPGTRVLRVAITAAMCVLGIIVAIGVIGLRWHYFTDTVAGAAVGIGTVCGLALLLDLPVARRQLARVCRRSPADGERPAQAKARV